MGEKLEVDKMFSAFKTYFYEVQLNLKKIWGLTMAQVDFHHTNMQVPT